MRAWQVQAHGEPVDALRAVMIDTPKPGDIRQRPATESDDEVSDRIIAVVNNDAITLNELIESIVVFRAENRQATGGPTDEELRKGAIQGLLALDPPGIDVISTNPTPSGCPPSIITSVAPTVNLGQGQFTPINDNQRQLLVASDGTKAYALASNLGSVLVYDIVAGTASAIGLTGNATVEDGDLTLDGTLLYVAESDGTVHALNTATNNDIQTITFPPNFNVSFVCTPDLLAIQP